MTQQLTLAHRRIGADQPPLVIAEIGINHEGSFEKALAMVDAAARAGCECVKFQSHVVDDEMIPNTVVPGNANESSVGTTIDMSPYARGGDVPVHPKLMRFIRTPQGYRDVCRRMEQTFADLV